MADLYAQLQREGQRYVIAKATGLVAGSVGGMVQTKDGFDAHVVLDGSGKPGFWFGWQGEVNL